MVALGVALSTAILTGALFIGDSMRFSLEKITLSRLGNTTHLISVTDRYFRAALARELSQAAGVPAAPVLMLEGMAVAEGGAYRVNHLTINGIDAQFGAIFPGFPTIQGDQVLISENVALQLNVKTGDPIMVRIAKASPVPRNTPFVSEKEATVTLRATVAAILPSAGAGLFNLRNSQSAPHNLFVSLERLNSLMALDGKANRVVVTQNPPTRQIDSLLREIITPADASLFLRELPTTGEWEISTERIFLDRETAQAFTAHAGARPLMTYFVNSIATGKREVPYSFASSLPGASLAVGDIVVNDWVAGDLGVAAGDSVTMTWYEIGPLRQLVEKNRRFRICRVVPLAGVWADSTLMPPLPGMADAGHCREWEAGVPIDLGKIRDRDEDYWNRYRGTPKIFVSPELAGEIWANRFGEFTAIRFPTEHFSEQQFLRLFREKLTPAALGFSIAAVQESGMAAARGGVDFGQLFLGLSFFLLLAAIILTVLLFRLNLETRESQLGTLLHLGFTPRKAAGLLMAETSVVAIAGGAAGIPLAVAYVRVIFAFLNTLWWDIVRTPVIFLKINPSTLALGAFISLLVALGAVAFPLRGVMKRQIADLHRRSVSPPSPQGTIRRRVAALLLTTAALLLLLLQLTGILTAHPVLFFLSGALLLAGMVAAFSLLLASLEGNRGDAMTPGRMALRMAARHRKRSTAIFLLFALGTFIVVATGANRQNLYARAADPTSGTGGFSAWAELSVPLLYDLNDPARRTAEGIDTSFSVVQFSRVAGDDASCLNLNKIDNPPILGVNPALLKGRFSFATATPELNPEDPWASLTKSLPGGVIPGIADQTVIQWGLMMKIGDTLLYQAESGDTLRIRLIGGLAPSIFQGSVIIAESHFYRYFPTHSGSTAFLTRWAPENEETLSGEIRDLLRDSGIEMTPASRRLAEFSSVTNTYLSIFLALGVLALALGTVGLALVVARAILERRHELATFLALGFPRKKVVLHLFTEYLFLLAAGTVTGFVAGLTAVIPSLTGSHNPISASTITLLILLILLNGSLWIYLLARSLVTPSRLLPALRDQ